MLPVRRETNLLNRRHPIILPQMVHNLLYYPCKALLMVCPPDLSSVCITLYFCVLALFKDWNSYSILIHSQIIHRNPLHPQREHLPLVGGVIVQLTAFPPLQLQLEGLVNLRPLRIPTTPTDMTRISHV